MKSDVLDDWRKTNDVPVFSNIAFSRFNRSTEYFSSDTNRSTLASFMLNASELQELLLTDR